MAGKFVLNVDLANVYRTATGKKELLTTVAWGDLVEVDEAGSTAAALKVNSTWFETRPDGTITPHVTAGFMRPPKSSKLKPMDLVIKEDQSKVLKVNFIDVQQGDGSVIETPKGRVILIDGGDNQLFARYLANRFRGTSAANPREIDAIVVTHGDADHFLGLTEIAKSESNRNAQKRLFIDPKRVYHNGLVKRPGKRNGVATPETESLGKTEADPSGDPVIVGLVDDLLAVPDSEMNEPFVAWKRALEGWTARSGPIEFRRLESGADNAFQFVADEAIDVKVLGPLTTKVGQKTGLKFLRQPPQGPHVRDEAAMTESPRGSLSASHTINGHSIVLQLTYGRFRALFAGDLNAEAEDSLIAEHAGGAINLRAELFKVPHHGSADFAPKFLEAVSPVISVVSSGDENARKEYIHPRATLMGALGKHSRLSEPLIFVTELVAFFEVKGWTKSERHKRKNGQLVDVPAGKRAKDFFAFSRTAFGAVKVRTDGERMLVYTNSGQKDLKEAYAFKIGAQAADGSPGAITIDAVRSV